LESLAIREKRDREVLKHPTSPGVRHRRVTLLCAEAFRPAACCVEDALVARGWEVALETGTQARPALRRLLREKNPGLLVVCIPDRVDESLAAKMRARLDPEGRGDLHIVSIETPRSVIEAVERLAGQPRAPRASRPRRPRSVLAHPTLVEQQIGPNRLSWMAIGAAAVLVLAAIGLETRARDERSMTSQVERSPAISPGTSSLLVDETVLSAVAPIGLSDDEPTSPVKIEVRSQPSTPVRLVTAAPELEPELAEDGDVDFERLGPAPLEEVEHMPSPRAIASVPGIRRSYTVDPFDPFDPIDPMAGSSAFD
jgi:hypothetical protein